MNGLELTVDFLPHEMPLVAGSIVTDNLQSIAWSVIPRVALVSFLIWVILRQLKRLAARFQADTTVQPGWAVLCGILLGYSTLMFFTYGAFTISPTPLERDRFIEMTMHCLEHGWGAGALAIAASLGVVRFHRRTPSQRAE